MSKWYPPLLVPIPIGHACHYTSNITKSWSPRQGNSSLAKVYNLLQQRSKVFNNNLFGKLFAELPQPSTYYRLFKKRKKPYTDPNKRGTSSKNFVSARVFKTTLHCYKLDEKYFLLDHANKIIKPYRTKKEALKDLERDTIKVRKKGKWITVNLESGYRVVTVPNRYIDALDVIQHDKLHWPVVQVKRCGSCPNTISNKGVCHCQFWSSIRDGSQKAAWLSPHEYKMKQHRDTKKEQRIIRIKLKLQDLFDE